MTQMTSSSVRPPNREPFEPEPTSLRGKSLLHWFGKRIAMGILCSMIATGIYRAADLAKVVRYFCSFVVHVGGDPLTGEGGIVTKLEDKLEKAIDKTPHIGVPAGSVPSGSPFHKSPEQLQFEAEQKEAKRIREEESERRTLLARADVLKLVCDKDWPLEKLRVELREAELQAREAQEKAEEEERKKPLLARADKIGLQVDPTADYKTLKHQVEEAEKELAADADFQASHREWERAMEKYRWTLAHGNNAACPKCRNLMHINNPKGQGQCRRCLGIFPKSQMVAAFRPPPPPKEPQPPMKNPGLWTRFKGLMR